MKSLFEDTDIEMNSIHNEEKSVVAERFLRTLKNKMYFNIQNVCIDKSDDILL